MSEVSEPSETDGSPLTWPRWLKTLVLSQVVAQAFIASWCAPAFIPAFVQLSEEMHKSITAISYLVGAYALLMGFGVLIWNPMADQFGKRPVTIVSMLLAVCASCGVASAQSYGSMMAGRVLEGFGVCGAFSLGVAYIKEMYSPSERGRAVGVWTLGITIGPFISPLIGGFIAYYVSYRWILWLCTMLLGVLLLLQIACLPEGSQNPHSKFLSFPSLVDVALTNPLQAPLEGTTLYVTFIQSLIRTVRATRYIPVWLAGLAFVVPYCYGIVSLTNLFPVIYGEVYGFDDRVQGLLYIPLLIGSLIAEGITGRAGDWIVYGGRHHDPLGFQGEIEVENKERRMITAATPPPRLERRLIIGHAGTLLSIIGFLWFGLAADRHDHWALLAVGSGVMACGVQVVTSVCFSYCVDCYPKPAKEVATVLNLFRALGSFVVLFYNQQLVANLGDGWGFGLQCFMTAFFSFGGFGLLGVFGERIRSWQA